MPAAPAIGLSRRRGRRALRLSVSVAVLGAVVMVGCRRKSQPARKQPTRVEKVRPAEETIAPPAEPVSDDSPTLAADPRGRWKNGARLRALVHDAGQGAQRRSSWWDTKLSVRCEFVETEAGFRCLPLEESASEFFSDDACGAMVHVPSMRACEAPAPGTLLRRRETDPCGVSYTAARVAGESVQTSTWIENAATGDCIGGGKRKVEAVPLSNVELETFVGGEVVREPSAGELEVLVLRGEDGSELVLGVALPDGPRCVEHGFEAARHCVPEDALYVSEVEFSDAQCETRDVVWYPKTPEGCEAPSAPEYGTFATDRGANNCYTHVVHRLEGELLRKKVYARQSGECRSTQTDGRFYRIGEELPEGALPRFADVELGEGRLRLTVAGELGGDGLRALVEGHRWSAPMRGQWFDAERDTPCLPRRTSAGELRCLPERVAALSDDFFADDACEIGLVQAREDPCAEGPAAAALVSETDGCDPRVRRVYEAEPWEGAVFSRRGKRCEKREVLVGEVYYRPGDEIPLEGFAAVTEKIGRALEPSPPTPEGETGTGR